MVTVIRIIILVFKLLDYISAKNKKMDKVIKREVVLLVKDGMLNARLGKKEYETFMRLAGILNIDDIELSHLEING